MDAPPLASIAPLSKNNKQLRAPALAGCLGTRVIFNVYGGFDIGGEVKEERNII
jgi:hypothetical protein